MNDHQMTGGGAVPQWIHGMGVAVWVSDDSGKIVFMNDRAESVLGRDAASTIGMPSPPSGDRLSIAWASRMYTTKNCTLSP